VHASTRPSQAGPVMNFFLSRLGIFLLTLAFCLPAWAAVRAETETPAETVGVMVDSQSYLVNLEYTGAASEYREGETFFGEYFTLAAVYRPSPAISLAAGAFLGWSFGKDDELEEIEPYFRFFYRPNDNFDLTFGNLSRERHTFLEAIFDDALVYDRPTEHGLELYGGWKWFSQSVWVNWQGLNTPEHREKFDLGAITKADLDWLCLDFQFHYIHRGGQLFDVGPVYDDFSLALGGQILLPIPFLDRSGLAAHWLHSHIIPDRSEDERLGGDGAELTLFAEKWGVRVFASYWFGDEFLTEDGDPFYRADDFFKFGLAKTFDLTDWISLEVGANGYVIDGEFVHDEHLLIGIHFEYDRPIKSPWRKRD